MPVASLLTVVALLLIAWDITHTERSPWRMLSGLGLLLAAIALRVFTGSSLPSILVGVFTDVGVGLLVAALLMTLRRGQARPFLAIGLLALGLSSLVHFTTRFVSETMDPATEETSFLLELGPDDQIEEVAPFLERFDVQYERAFPSLTLAMDEDLAQVYLVTGEADRFGALMDALRSDTENVDYVSLNRIVRLSPLEARMPDEVATEASSANDPLVKKQWALGAINGHKAHDLLRQAQPQRKALVAIVDTGVDQYHEDLRSTFSASPGSQDLHGHGTHCAGIAGAATNNNKGVASLNWNGAYVKVAGYPALSAMGFGTVESIAQAIIDAAQDGADVISMSLGDYAPVPPKIIVNAIAFAQRMGAIVLASAGNSNADARDHMPSNVEGVIVVSAVDQNLQKARFSNTNTSLAYPLAAPGVDILSLKPNNKYVPLSGTSMSTPMVSGLVGVMRALNPSLTTAQVFEILHETGTTLDDSPRIGRLINAEAAIQAVLQSS